MHSQRQFGTSSEFPFGAPAPLFCCLFTFLSYKQIGLHTFQAQHQRPLQGFCPSLHQFGCLRRHQGRHHPKHQRHTAHRLTTPSSGQIAPCSPSKCPRNRPSFSGFAKKPITIIGGQGFLPPQPVHQDMERQQALGSSIPEKCPRLCPSGFGCYGC